MEINQLQGFVMLIVLTGMLIGVGVLTVDKFGVAVKDSTATSESVTIAAQAGATTNDDVTAVAYFGNATFPCTSFNSATACMNWTSGGVLSTNSSYVGSQTINYTYDADSAATSTLFNVRTELGTIASTWLGLIIVIAVLAIILMLVIKSFGMARQ